MRWLPASREVYPPRLRALLDRTRASARDDPDPYVRGWGASADRGAV
ncbi:hypothetical protein [Streptomyces liangshanensis]